MTFGKWDPNGRLLLWVFLFHLSLYVTLSRGHFWSMDEVNGYQQTRSLWERGDLAVVPTLNTLPGRDGRYYAVTAAGQSILAIPWYASGKSVRSVLETAGAQKCTMALAGPVLGENPQLRWGGEVEIFFVCLFNCFVVAAICAVFFSFSILIGARPRWALVATVLLGTASYIAGFSTNFFQHAAETLFLLLSFYFLAADARSPNWTFRLQAGAAAFIMLLVRVSTVVALPALSAYLLWTIWQRRNREWRAREWMMQALGEAAPFAIPVLTGILSVAALNCWKFGEFSLSSGYDRLLSFNSPLWVSLYAYLFSPGCSIFLFTPLLILLPWYMRPFYRRYRPEALAILGIAIAYLLFYGRVEGWHSQWSFGVRYLAPLTPLLLLPFSLWIERIKWRAWLAAGALAACGLVIQVLHFAVNVSYVYYHEHYMNYPPEMDFLFVPSLSQVPAHWRGLMAWDGRVDLWLVNIYRMLGVNAFMIAAVPLFGLVLLCGWRMWRALRPVESYSLDEVVRAEEHAF